MSKELTFVQNERNWTAETMSEGKRFAVEVNRADVGPFQVKGSIDGLTQVVIADFGPGAFANLLFEVSMPKGVNIHFVSHSEVVSSKITV